MMNIAIIFAGGVGSRMGNQEIPKQFIEIDGKPILIHTVENFQKNENVDSIILVILDEWIDYTKQLINARSLGKVEYIIPGGSSGQMSIFNGVKCAYENYSEDSTVLIHDGVRPFITNDLINNNIETVNKFGSAISSVEAIETFLITDENQKVVQVPKRSNSIIAKAPQSFILKDIYSAHIKAQEENLTNFIDSSTLMHNYGYSLSVVYTDHNNIKITTPKDIELANSIYYNILGGE